MKIVCDSCGAKYSIADEKVAGKIFKIRCKKCSSVLEVRGDQTGAHPFGDPGGSQDSGADPAWYIVVDGEQKGPLRPIELSQLFAKGAVGLDSYVWKEGFDDWKVAADVADLAQIFGGPGAARQQAAAESGDDTSAFGTGGDLFTDGGRESTGEADTHGSMFGGFDEAPTPTDGRNAPAAAAASQDSGAAMGSMGSGLGGFGGGVAATAPQKMTGQRNENSVLFSLSNLQQLATRGSTGAPVATSREPASVGAAAPQAGGEGSGLIDIRALAQSTTPGTRQAQSQAVDDLLAIGGGGGGALGAPLLGPTPLETSERNRWLWIGGVAVAVIAIVGAGVGVGMALGGSEEDALEITPPVVQQAAPQNSQAVDAPTAVAAPTPTEAAEEEEVVDIEPEEPLAAATLEEPTDEDGAEERSARRQRSSSSSQRRRSSSSSRSAAAPEPAPARKSNNLDALMDEVVGGSTPKPKEARSTAPSTSSNLPDAPSRDDVKTALQGVGGAVKACGKDEGGTAIVDVTFSGKTGRATGATVASGPFKGTPVGSCIESAVKRARVPRFKQSSFKVTFPYRL